MARNDMFVYGENTALARKHFSEIQRGECAICRDKATLLVDHEHSELGLCRGLLCEPCNFGLGWFRDRVGALGAAITYLSDHEDRNSAYRETEQYRDRAVKVTRLPVDSTRKAVVYAAYTAGEPVNSIAKRFEMPLRAVYKAIEEEHEKRDVAA